MTGDLLGNSVIRVEKIRFENMSNGIYSSYEEAGDNTVLIRHCEFMGNHDAVALIGDGGDARISGCSFNYMARDGLHIGAFRQSNLVVENCSFVLLDHHHWPQQHSTFWGVQRAQVRDCRFRGGKVGVTATMGATVDVDRCRFEAQGYWGVRPLVRSTLTVTDCTFRDQRIVANSITSDNDAQFRRCTIEDVSDVAFLIGYTGDFAVNDCDLSGGERGIVWCDDRNSCAGIQTLDMTGNYWGTADPDSIQALIRDLDDIDNTCFYIDYEPFESESTPTETRSLSDLKGLFR